jgi:Fe-S-cluster containining protein
VPPSRKFISLETAVAQLCPECALCCNGVLFKDVELQPGDDAEKLESLGLPISETKTRKSPIVNRKFPQPCAALTGCRCRIYADRPARCRQFECALLKSVHAGETEVAVALRVIRRTRQRADQVRALLREIGDVDEALALSLRFKRTRRRVEASPPDDASAEIFSRLTLAVHDLNLLLSGKFYPG